MLCGLTQSNMCCLEWLCTTWILSRNEGLILNRLPHVDRVPHGWVDVASSRTDNTKDIANLVSPLLASFRALHGDGITA